MNEVYIPYDFSVEKGQIIPKEYFEKGKKLYTQTLTFCKNNLSEGKYEVDKSVYAEGIKVICKYKKDLKIIKQWIQQ